MKKSERDIGKKLASILWPWATDAEQGSLKEMKRAGKENYNMLIRRAKNYTRQAIEAENAGDKTTAQALRVTAQQAYDRAEEMARHIPIGVTKTPAHAGKKKPRTKKTPSRSGRKLTVNEMMAGVFRGVEKVTGKNLATDTLQYATTPEECRQWVKTVKAMFTDREGKLDKKGYCNALNTTRDNMLFTVSELQKAIEDARRSGDAAAVPGYEVMIERNQTNAGILEKEIKSNGGKVN